MKGINYKRRLLLWAMAVAAVLLVSELSFWGVLSHSQPQMRYETLDECQHHVLLITETRNQDFWREVYQGVVALADENHIAIEWRQVDSSVEGSIAGAIRAAKAVGVDGILTCVSADDGIATAINQAAVSGIPVITLMEDVPASKRHGCVGIDSYSFGISVANSIEGFAPASQNAVMFTRDTAADARLSDKVLIAGFKSELGQNPSATLELLPIEDNLLQIEAVIQDVALQNRSFDTVVCRDMEETYACASAVIENNLVGKIRIVGYGSSESLLEYVEKGVVQALITTDAKSIGGSAMQNYLSYQNEGWMNEFTSSAIEVVTPENAARYRAMHSNG